ncbi:competence protein ComEC [Persephonella hydrogeniphila]|uniref:Competence protein ComEC n=1 Tax=Persephonella hydrogeniphila TaxID=198703 RepID=A0A285NGT2_9AQUI|nr:ComEC/Rec2 family competence protein [Persephonella hydrogeniphila]SNZ07096.1 competence protein ComEC [Persephonella hydrogeniphila]
MKDFFIIPFFLLAGGIWVSDIFKIDIPVLIPASLLLLCITLNKKLSFFLLIPAVFLLGISLHKNPKIVDKEYVYISCITLSAPYVSDRFTSFSCLVKDSDLGLLENNRIMVYLKEENREVFTGSTVSFIGKIKKRDRVVVAYPYKDFIYIDNRKNILYPVYSFKKMMMQNYRQNTLNDTSYNLGLALIFGEKGYLKEEKENFINAGTSHLLAISGMHVGMIILIILFLFGLKKRFSYYTAGIFLIFYPLFTGLHIPVIRASMLGILYVISKIKYLKISSLNLLFFVAFAVLLFSPISLFSVSFQLSFLAVFGLIMYSKLLNTDFKNKVIRFIHSSFFMSVIAVLFTTPVILHYFGKFSLTTLVATPALVLILFPYLFLSVLNLITLFSIPPMVKTTDFIGEFFLKTNNFFGELNFVHSGYNPDKALVIFFISLLILIAILKINNYLKLSVSVLLLFIFLTLSSTKPEYKVYVFKGRKYPDYLVVTPYGDCIYSKKIYKIRTIIDKNRCKYTGKESRFSDIKIIKTKNSIKIKIKNSTFILKNTDYTIHPVWEK